jgi:DNA-binding PadR family transcriptional regulator
MAELTSADYAFLIILKAEGRELSNTEMDKRYRVRLISPAYERLNGEGYVSSQTKSRPYRHAITDEGKKVLADPLDIDEDRAEEGEKRSPREKQLWAAVVAQQNQIVRLLAKGNGAATVVERPVDLDGRIRAAYTKLAGAPGEWVGLATLRPLFADVSKTEFDKALERMLDARDVRLEPDALVHRLGAEERGAAVRIGGEDRHKLAIGRR